jgi:hypothetical protein
MKTQTNQEQEGDSKAGFDQEVLKLDFSQLKDGLSGFVRGTVEEALNGLLQAEAEHPSHAMPDATHLSKRRDTYEIFAFLEKGEINTR